MIYTIISFMHPDSRLNLMTVSRQHILILRFE